MKRTYLRWQAPQVYDLDLVGHGHCVTGSSANPGRCATGESTATLCSAGTGVATPHDCGAGGRAGGCQSGSNPGGNSCQTGPSR